MHTFTALYDQQSQAQAAQAQLTQLGIIPADRIRLTSKDSAGMTGERTAHEDKGFWDSLKDFFVSDDDRGVYEEGVRQGGYLLTVNVDDQYSDRVEDLLDESGAVNVTEREEQYRQSGVLGARTQTTADTTLRSQAAVTGTAAVGEQAIPIVQEQLRVGKRQVNRGGVRVRSYMLETPVHESVNLREEHVGIERRAVNQPVTPGAAAASLQGRTIEMRETAEEAVVAKDARVVEEVVVKKTVGERVETVNDTVRHTEVAVERLPGTPGTPGAATRTDGNVNR